MSSLGNVIRTARLQTGLSLEQVNAKTRISLQNLQAIEDDDLSQFSSAFFYKSFVRQFAREVNVDYESLAPLIQTTIANMPEPVIPGQRDVIIEKAVLAPMSRSRRLRWFRPLGTLLLVLVSCSGLYTFWENSKTRLKDIVSPIANAHVPVAAANAPKPVQPQDGFQVEISGIERSWLALAADGRPIFSGFLEADQTKILRAHEVGRIRTGNAGGVSLVFNGKPIGVAGPRGQIRTVVFTKNNYEVLPPPLHVAWENPVVNGEWRLLRVSHSVSVFLPPL